MKLKHTLIFVFALVFTGFAVFNSMATYKMAERSSEDLLNSTAFFIGVTLHQALNRTGMDEELFRDVIKSEPREEISFIALYDKAGKMLLHSGSGPAGISAEGPEIKRLTQNTKPASSYFELESGKTLYVMDMPLHIRTLSPAAYILRIALHTDPAQGALTHAKIHGITAIIVIGFMWVLAFVFVLYDKRIDALHMKEIEKSHFTMLGEMAAVLAHEIRSPLSAIKGFAQYINEKREKTSSEEEGLEVIINESQRLERLTEDLLIYARTSEVNPEEFSLKGLVEDVEGLFIRDDKSLTIKKESILENDILNTDREKLKQILINIIQNAIDSMDGRGSIGIKLSDNGNTIYIMVKDSGTGMDQETLKSALRPFFTSKTKGTGLGLAIVDNLLKTLHGSLKIESGPDKGTEVTISLQRILR
jgi:two-component system sensor histidine kinase HydH